MYDYLYEHLDDYMELESTMVAEQLFEKEILFRKKCFQNILLKWKRISSTFQSKCVNLIIN